MSVAFSAQNGHVRSSLRGTITGGIVTIIGTIPGFLLVSAAISLSMVGETLYNYFADGGRVRSEYYMHVFSNGETTWRHTVWYYDKDSDGWLDYLACETKYVYG